MTTTHLHATASYPQVVHQCPYPGCPWGWSAPRSSASPTVADAIVGTEVRDVTEPHPADCTPPLPQDWAHYLASAVDAAYHRALDSAARQHLDDEHPGWTLSDVRHLARIAAVEPRGDTIAAQSLVLAAAARLRNLAPLAAGSGPDLSGLVELADQLERFSRQLVPVQVPTGPDAAAIQFVEHDPNPF